MTSMNHLQTSCCGLRYSTKISGEFCENVNFFYFECKSDSKFCPNNKECNLCEKNIIPNYKDLCLNCSERGHIEVAEVLTNIMSHSLIGLVTENFKLPPPIFKITSIS